MTLRVEHNSSDSDKTKLNLTRCSDFHFHLMQIGNVYSVNNKENRSSVKNSFSYYLDQIVCFYRIIFKKITERGLRYFGSFTRNVHK